MVFVTLMKHVLHPSPKLTDVSNSGACSMSTTALAKLNISAHHNPVSLHPWASGTMNVPALPRELSAFPLRPSLRGI